MTSDVPQVLNYVLRGVNRLYKRAGNAFSPKIPHSVVGEDGAGMQHFVCYNTSFRISMPGQRIFYFRKLRLA